MNYIRFLFAIICSLYIWIYIFVFDILTRYDKTPNSIFFYLLFSISMNNNQDKDIISQKIFLDFGLESLLK
jgi:dolichyl-phosphate-mannose--protein O-mannosyl transferase